ncbi:hypothetical protein GCM10007304_30770 [Rhodococcoides trifolii]|uniref:Suppressor of fused-like domain-containing protein n=1 Tax=Rhodococcoides trifolii TaxID=908250 RepID=A0A917FYX2_9NOCA|nr:suppressor of fused domain protein [Rhodococcus trifolii]GGG14621.1 hypothetical protein GCM10007304_30770 [Rhodococcus trifolii]
MSRDVAALVRAHLIAAFDDDAPGTASVTFLGLEPMDVLRFGPEADGSVRYTTVGCSRHPMGDPGAMVTDPDRGPRAELILTVRGNAPGVHKKMAVLAASPAVEGVVFVADALLDAGESLWDGAPFTAVLLGRSHEVDDLALAEPADPVAFFDAVPITQTEAAWVRLKGAQALREAWAEAGIDVRDPSRAAASF